MALTNEISFLSHKSVGCDVLGLDWMQFNWSHVQYSTVQYAANIIL
jgi:hypothetical protein